MEKFLGVVDFIETRFGSLFAFRRKTTMDVLFAIGLIILFSLAHETFQYFKYYWDPEQIDYRYLISTNFYYAIILGLIYLLWTENKSGLQGLTFFLAYWLLQEIMHLYFGFQIYSYLFLFILGTRYLFL